MESKRQRPGDDFASLKAEAGQVLARSKAAGSNPVSELREIDRKLWPVVIAALVQCRDNAGKLHPEIADSLLRAIEGGLAGKIPLSWPEPTGQHATWATGDAAPADIVALYLAARREGLLSNPLTNGAIADLFKVDPRTIENWRLSAVTINRIDNSKVNLACNGYVVRWSADGKYPLDRYLEAEMRLAAEKHLADRGRSKR